MDDNQKKQLFKASLGEINTKTSEYGKLLNQARAMGDDQKEIMKDIYLDV